MKKLALLLGLLSFQAFGALSTPDLAIIPVKNFAPNPGAEYNLAQWATFNNGASSVPTTMTGGSLTGNVTFTRNVSSPLNGNADFLMTKAAANAQGDGWATAVTLPIAYRGSNLTIAIPFKITSGSIVQGDLGVWAYDVTNGVLLTQNDSNYWVVGSQGTLVTSVASSTSTASIRVGFYFASTSTAAATIHFDDMVFGPGLPTQGMAGSNTVAASLTPAPGFGTVTNANYTMTQVGDRVVFRGSFTVGTVAGTSAYIQLPTGMNIDTTKLQSVANIQSVGHGEALTSAAGVYEPVALYYDGTNTDRVLISEESSTNAFLARNVNSVFGSGWSFSFEFTVPIAGKDANVVLASSSQFLISSALASGTRVTGSAPTALGQYRSYLRNAGAFTFTETNGSPSTAPSTANGIKLWTASTFAAADPSNQPSAYDIFVGKNKTIKVIAYTSTGYTGALDISPQVVVNTGIGLNANYDQSTGIVTIRVNGAQFATTNLSLGLDPIASANVTTAYFDIVVSNNALSVGLDNQKWHVDAYEYTTASLFDMGVGNVASQTDISSSGGHLVLNGGSLTAQVTCTTTNPSTGLTCAAGNPEVGIAFVPPTTGYAKVCAQFAVTLDVGGGASTGSVTDQFELVVTPNNAQTISTHTNGSVNVSHSQITTNARTQAVYPTTVCGVIPTVANVQTTVRLFYLESVSGTINASQINTSSTSNVSGSAGNGSISWFVTPI